MEIVLYILGVIGFTHIMVDSKIMQPVRDWFNEPSWSLCKDFLGKLVSPTAWFKTVGQILGCYQCCGFWCGLVVGWAVGLAGFWLILSAGFAGSFLANAAAIYLNYLEAQTIVHLDPGKEDKGENG